MTGIRIELEEGDAGGRYVGRIDGVEGEAEITFTRRGANVISANHTFAPDNMRGTGAAFALVEYMVADARRRGFKIAPVCSYIVVQFRKHPEWSDVMAR